MAPLSFVITARPRNALSASLRPAIETAFRTLLCAGLAIAPTAASAGATTDAPQERTEVLSPPLSPSAETLRRGLEAAGWRCRADVGDAAEPRGLRCRGRVAGYPEPVRVFVARAFSAGCALDLAIHLHGFNLGSTASERHFSGGRGRFDAFLSKAGRTSTVAVALESQGDGLTYATHLRDPRRAALVLDQVTEALRSAGAARVAEVRRLAISAHSGADGILAGWTAALPPPFGPAGPRSAPGPMFERYLSRLERVGFFDSIYALDGRDRFAAYAEANGAWVASFYFSGQRNSPFNEALREALARAPAAPMAAAGAGHCARAPLFVREDLRPGDALLPRHYGMLAENGRYARFLGACAPPPREACSE